MVGEVHAVPALRVSPVVIAGCRPVDHMPWPSRAESLERFGSMLQKDKTNLATVGRGPLQVAWLIVVWSPFEAQILGPAAVEDDISAAFLAGRA